MKYGYFGKLLFPLSAAYLLAIVLIHQYQEEGLVVPTTPQDKIALESKVEYEKKQSLEEIIEIRAIQQKLEQPRHLKLYNDGSGEAKPHQVLHLHNMKTGGTSIDRRLRCAIKRLQSSSNMIIPHYSIHECWRGIFKKCLENEDDACRQKMNNATIMSFCGPLKHVDKFGWVDRQNPLTSFTMLRHPVDRVWSMYRYQTDNCFRCRNLTYVYTLLDAGDWPMFDNLCMSHLHNKQVANLMSKDLSANATGEEKLESAIENMKSFFTVVGLTEEMKATEKILSKAIPWLEEYMEGTNVSCALEHSNKAPTNNGCIKDYKKKTSYHWYLPSYPDEYTRKIILEHNQLDLKLYEAAKEYFQLQKKAIGFKEDDV